jgi:nicotinamide mononucleotide transporter
VELSPLEIAVMVGASLFLIAASYFKWLPLPMTEVLGFVTGGVCVWLVVREHLWNWPIGMANNVFFFILFYAVFLGMCVVGLQEWRRSERAR